MSTHGFQHVALLYDDADEFASAATPFVAEGIDDGEAVVVVTTRQNAEALRDGLGAKADDVAWGVAEEWYLRPAVMFERFTDAISDLARTQAGRIRVVGEQVHDGRSPGEVRELLRYEALANLVFRPSGSLVLCPYHRATTAPRVLDDVCRTHPFLWQRGELSLSDGYLAPEAVFAEGDASDDLPAPPPYATVIGPPFDAVDVRQLAAAMGRGFLADDRVQDLVFAVNEALNNAEVHGGGATRVALWLDGRRLTCEVRDAGPGLPHPLCGYLRPDGEAASGRGLWLARQLCDVVEVRSRPDRGTTVRLHVS